MFSVVAVFAVLLHEACLVAQEKQWTQQQSKKLVLRLRSSSCSRGSRGGMQQQQQVKASKQASE